MQDFKGNPRRFSREIMGNLQRNRGGNYINNNKKTAEISLDLKFI